MTLEAWLSLTLLCLLGAMTPGPSLAVVLGNLMHGGRAAGLAAGLAHGLAVGLYALLTVAGLAAVVAASPLLFALMQLGAAGYLGYLAYGALRPLSVSAGVGQEQAQPARNGSPAREGFLIAFLNPKLAVFMLALFAPFITVDQGLTAKLVLVLTVGSIDALWYATLVLVIVQAGLLPRLKRHTGLIERLFGVLLLALALFVLSRAIAGLSASAPWPF
ncbi:LysE family translocator [Thiocapsa sp. UBA6158]|jgi:threonine/homoserine/homoserine lactone efflux protein|uniref:LysE family translocator n=1 Tax=Thiocapsa sp. UBA6158 TaxID=1947692 RepID=UPI001D65B8FE|nr:LysE family transporter [Thiocapsa sp. UBA6158]NCU21084.1 LysE family translocator [Candidatus Falkowbacteria bacterium]